jgi:hypothetical protein
MIRLCTCGFASDNESRFRVHLHECPGHKERDGLWYQVLRLSVPPRVRQPRGDQEQSTNIRGRTCMCNGCPKCRYDHRLKQHPWWAAEYIETR